MPQPRAPSSHRDSWPPTTMRVQPGAETLDHDPDSADESLLDKMDANPLTYFLTPTPLLDDSAYTFDMGLDAGIEDENRPREIVRSVSPSSLHGLKMPSTPRSASPDPAGSGRGHPEPYLDVDEFDDDDDDDEDDDDEDYIRFSSQGGLPLPAKTSEDLALALVTPSDTFLSPSRTARRTRSGQTLHNHGQPSRGRKPQHHQRLGARNHVWREPSPDVWSIEEEEEEEEEPPLEQVRGGDVKHVDAHVPATKPKKVVRFVLPVKE